MYNELNLNAIDLLRTDYAQVWIYYIGLALYTSVYIHCKTREVVKSNPNSI